jgi:archaellum component FlaC
LIEKISEKYLKKLIGKTDMEDALKRLDKLTNEEARMATAQVLMATQTVDYRVRGVDDNVLNVDKRVAGVDDRVAAVDDRVAGVDSRVEGVESRVASVDDKVKAVDDKVAVVIDGALPSSVDHQENMFNSDVPRGKGGEGSHTENGKRHGSSETFVISYLH